MDRRAFLSLRRAARDSSPKSYAGVRRIDTGLAVYTGAWGTKEIVHLLKRTMFGAKKSDIEYFRTLSTVQAVDALLNVSAAVPAPPLKNYTGPDAVAAGATWVTNWHSDPDVNSYRLRSLKFWWTGRMINQDRTILEKMTLFWHNHFSTETIIYRRGTFAYDHNALLRANSLGNFKSLVRLVTLDRAMLVYLNNFLNVKEAPDENYARELMELFTLGKENNPNYAEADVQAAARVLTGWAIDFTNNDTMAFDPVKHDTGNKTFSSFFNNTIITGASGATAGDTELDALLNMIFAKQVEVSEFIIRKLYRWFCYYTIDANTEINVIKPLAAQFRTNWEIKPVLSTLFKSEHFFDALNQGCLIKSPIDLAVGLCREFNVTFPADYANQYNMWEFIHFECGNMQQHIGDPPSVSGWPAYYQLPQFHEIWINNDTLPKRNILSDLLIQLGYTRNGNTLRIDPLAFAQALANPGDPNALINDSLDILYRVPLSDASKATIKKVILLGNQEEDYYWTNVWNGYVLNPGDMANTQIVRSRLQTFYKYLMNLAEYQLS